MILFEDILKFQHIIAKIITIQYNTIEMNNESYVTLNKIDILNIYHSNNCDKSLFFFKILVFF